MSLGRRRTFDHEIAQAMRADGLTLEVIAQAMGVSEQAVRYATSEKQREYAKRYQQENRTWMGTCRGCGGEAARYRGIQALCRSCRAKARTESVRPDALRCCRCREWLPDECFSPQRGKAVRRERNAECKPCAAARRRANRVPREPVLEFIVVEPERPAKPARPARAKGTKSGRVREHGYYIRPEQMQGAEVPIFATWPTKVRQIGTPQSEIPRPSL